jgi:hypothetical protein
MECIVKLIDGKPNKIDEWTYYFADGGYIGKLLHKISI